MIEPSKLKSRRDHTSIEAIDPADGKPWELLLSGTLLARVGKHSMGKSLELAHSVTNVLRYPKAIFQGIRDLDRDVVQDDWLCYVGVPPHAYDYKTDERRSPWQGQTMLIYVNGDRVIYNWYWASAHNKVAFLPEDYEDRFEQRVL